ncbi:aldolase [Polyplosphaeria fusca]|uniref:deoxyribose-phosphate aldolase n=1 Tax=Polyplosphaeria fusca TaxID=682080 RepID=A0A9P4RDI5_9PLEO|nr:aldolase [Polyplosphaeria fusca]
MPTAAEPTNSPNSSPTESQVLIDDFLTSHPDLDKALGEIEIMTDRYTNAEWAAQIAESQRKILNEKGTWEGKGDKKVEGPRSLKELAQTVDHTVLKLDATGAHIDALCSEARTEGFKSVCVRLNYVQRCISNLKGSDVVVACVVGFHEGTQDTYSKLREARAAVAAGAKELDLVLNYSILTQQLTSNKTTSGHSTKPSDSTVESLTASNTAANSKPREGATTPAEGPYSLPGSVSAHKKTTSALSQNDSESSDIPDYSSIYRELASIRSLCPAPTILKLILETSQLTPAQIVAASHLAAAANFDFIKTSTGFNGPGASLPNVSLMVACAEYLSTKTKENKGSPIRGNGRKMHVKASGGVRSLRDAVKMLEVGASRLGTSSGLWIMQEARKAPDEGDETRPPPTRLYTDDSVGEY